MATASNHTNRYSREEHRKQKELLDLRKSGAAMPELDEEGKMINPHIPQYISRTPWYYGSDAPSLKHQTNTVFSDRQQNLGGMESKKVVTKSTTNIGRQWRKGSCENCGSMSHKKRDCLERPRKVSARQANVTLSEDIKIDQADLDFSSKRDRWHNDDGSSFQEVVEKHEKISEARRLAEARKVEQQLLENAQKEQQRVLRRKEKLELKIVNRKEARLQRRALKRKNKIMAKLKLNTDTETETETDATTATDAVDTMTEQDMELVDISPIEDVSSEVSSDVSDSQADDVNSDVDGEKDSDEDIRDESQLVSANPSDKNKQTMRSLRIREDIPKYLRNLDLDSAYYDPKTRAMRENPYGDGKAGPDGYKGDTFLRESGLVQELSRVEAFADEAESRGEHISAYANPSLAESKYREFQQKLVEAEQAREVELEDTYGSSEIAKPLSSNVILAQSDIYVEYDSSGNVIQGQAEIIPSSKYLEDVKELNHSKVWGSYYDLGEHRWGYGCCQQTIRNVYCLAVAVQTVSDDSIPKRKIESTEEDNDQNKKIRVQ